MSAIRIRLENLHLLCFLLSFQLNVFFHFWQKVQKQTYPTWLLGNNSYRFVGKFSQNSWMQYCSVGFGMLTCRPQLAKSDPIYFYYVHNRISRLSISEKIQNLYSIQIRKCRFGFLGWISFNLTWMDKLPNIFHRQPTRILILEACVLWWNWAQPIYLNYKKD